MLKRTQQAQQIRQAMRLLTLRDNTARELGEETYQASVAQFTPFLRAEMKTCPCSITAANRLIEKLQDLGADLAVKRLVTCAAVDLALADDLAKAS